MFKDGLNLQSFVVNAVPEHVEEICDPLLLQKEEKNGGDQRQKVEECLISLARIGVACSAAMPRERKDMTIVVSELCLIRNVLMGTRMPRDC
ncbi:hypothetical protein C1H46_038502 [Malus baccata]|uniref:Serine-threonine/tyrosine-protein kinase catalytic domain-containing protein n=1 Tax=Malus baccata TaxID=106549 RepID=A0A540KP91_MALBA|nr:hypothetical protein C1H46_038502 [Malus baccata]